MEPVASLCERGIVTAGHVSMDHVARHGQCVIGVVSMDCLSLSNSDHDGLHAVDHQGDGAQHHGNQHHYNTQTACLADGEAGLHGVADLVVACDGDQQQDAPTGQAGRVHLKVHQLAHRVHGRRPPQHQRLDDHVHRHAQHGRGKVKASQHGDEGGEDGALHLAVVDVENQAVAQDPHHHQQSHHQAVGQARVHVPGHLHLLRHVVRRCWARPLVGEGRRVGQGTGGGWETWRQAAGHGEGQGVRAVADWMFGCKGWVLCSRVVVLRLWAAYRLLVKGVFFCVEGLVRL